MNLYLFSTVLSDQTVDELLLMRDGSAVNIGNIYPRLLDFCCNKAYTKHTVREYIIRLILQQLPKNLDQEIVSPYLYSDINSLYEHFYNTDWEELCEEQRLLSLPVAEKQAVLADLNYGKWVSDMVNSQSAHELCGLISEFSRKYLNADEAMYKAFKWEGKLCGVESPDSISFDNLYGLGFQKESLIQNTKAFAQGKTANDALLIGASGSGKSSCVKAALNMFSYTDLKLVEVPKSQLIDLPFIMEHLSKMKCRYIIFIDDLSFEHTDQSYLALKIALDGQIAKRPDNVVIYATSNLRHLVKETWKDRGEGDIHENDTLYEKHSLSERFGIRLYYQPLLQKEYLGVIKLLLEENSIQYTEQLGKEAVAWAGLNNGRSGRTAKQFVKNYLATSL